MTTTTVIALCVITSGTLLATAGAMVLGIAHARLPGATSRGQRIRIGIAQYLAASVALVGFLAIASGSGTVVVGQSFVAGVLGHVTAAATGVVMFAVSGAFFAKVADLAEDARTGYLPPTLLARAEAAAMIEAGTVRPGWIYQDAAGGWYLGVGTPDGGPGPLIRLPDFVVATSDEPAYPLRPVGPGEISVMAPDEHADREPDDDHDEDRPQGAHAAREGADEAATEGHAGAVPHQRPSAHSPG